MRSDKVICNGKKTCTNDSNSVYSDTDILPVNENQEK